MPDIEPTTHSQIAKPAQTPPSLIPQFTFDRRIAWLSFFTGLPGALIALWLLWTGDFTPKVQWTLTLPKAEVLDQLAQTLAHFFALKK